MMECLTSLPNLNLFTHRDIKYRSVVYSVRGESKQKILILPFQNPEVKRIALDSGFFILIVSTNHSITVPWNEIRFKRKRHSCVLNCSSGIRYTVESSSCTNDHHYVENMRIYFLDTVFCYRQIVSFYFKLITSTG